MPNSQMPGGRELEDMTTTQSFPADSEIEAILEQRIEQENKGLVLSQGSLMEADKATDTVKDNILGTGRRLIKHRNSIPANGYCRERISC
ncbi:hypothetical protein [Leptolyngbya sp. UWPOB_LEPTO1]|uniref:hypothetical protein n=1 Tax=Leptolyngbya sp. UWPOB_LEPTO1 TaxID=2815653 RepID=UPI0025808785|nr:hypothetical protein [Leptolyngbya sp. UWPOB_LEPTO1]